jgi:hypothetical protein
MFIAAIIRIIMGLMRKNQSGDDLTQNGSRARSRRGNNSF